MSGRFKFAAGFSIYLLAGSGIACAQPQVIGAPPEALNMKLVGTSDLQARSAYQPTIHHQGDRWIAYIGHHGGSDDIPAPPSPIGLPLKSPDSAQIACPELRAHR